LRKSTKALHSGGLDKAKELELFGHVCRMEMENNR